MIVVVLSACALVTISALLLLAILKARPHPGLPSGPTTSLFTGNLPLTYGNVRFHLTLHELAKKYGGLYRLQMGWYPTVVISDYETLKRALITHGDIFNDRPMHVPYFKMLFRGKGMAMQNGEPWKLLRKVMMASMRDFGVRKVALEENIKQEVLSLIQEVNKHSGKPFETEIMFHKAVSNIICCMLFGNRFDYEDAEYSSLLAGLEFVFTTGGFQNPYVFLPYFTFITIPFTQPIVFKSIKHVRSIESFIKNRIKEHRETFDPNNLRDFVDLYLDAERKNPNSDIYTEANLCQVLMDIFMAGTESVSQTLNWALYFLIRYPQVQETCRNEILQVFGEEQIPSSKDKSNLPYVKATISEVQRFTATTGIFHNTKDTIHFDGFTLPKNTVVFTNLYSIHMDPKHWRNPDEFSPDRFLDEHRNYKRNEALVPFAIGKRTCPGESLATPELFIFLSSMLQKYRFTPVVDPTQLPLPEEATLGITLAAPPYQIRATPL